VLIGLAIFGVEDIRPNFLWHLCYLSNVRFVMDGYYHLWVAHFWSLSVEEQFYLLWPAVILFTPRQWLVPVIGGAIAIGPAYRLAALAFGFSGPACEVLLPACLDTLGTGAMLAVLLHQPGAWPARRKACATIGWAGFATFILFNVLDYFHLARATGFVVGDSLLAIFAAGLIAHAAYGCTGWGRRFLEFKPLVYVGAISYGLYVYHEIVTGVINWLTQSGAIRLAPWIVIGLRFGATFLVAALSWRFFEKPINNLKRFFPYPG
jgi:peptidoglycan/LPS O-acetylase OafA/YrhL